MPVFCDCTGILRDTHVGQGSTREPERRWKLPYYLGLGLKSLSSHSPINQICHCSIISNMPDIHYQGVGVFNTAGDYDVLVLLPQDPETQ